LSTLPAPINRQLPSKQSVPLPSNCAEPFPLSTYVLIRSHIRQHHVSTTELLVDTMDVNKEVKMLVEEITRLGEKNADGKVSYVTCTIPALHNP